MKITGLSAYPVWGGSRNFLFVVVDTDSGVYGVGEAGLTGREEAVCGAVRHFSGVLAGQDPMRIEHLWQLMFRGGFFPAGHAVAAALSAVDIALWDLKGKVLGVPVFELLGGRVRDRVVCYPHNGGGHPTDTDALVASCRESVAEGWRFVRWGLPADGDRFEPRPMVRLALEQFAAVREAVGEDVELLLDVHTRLDLADAVRLCREAEPFHPFFIEDPLRSEHLDAYGLLRPRTAVPIAAGEQLASKWEFRPLIENGWIDVARIDLGIAGGLTEAKKIAAMAEAHHIRVAVHNPLGPVSTAACLHLNLAIPNFAVQEQPSRPGGSLTDVVTGQPQWSDGCLLPPTGPGLGVEFDREAARRHPYRPTELPTLYRDDGALTNW
jgi:galactonate dehydratase